MKRTMALGALVALAGCAESPMQAKTPSAATDQQATCRAAKDPNNPLIVEWPGTSRTALSAASQRGLVVVSYSGCVMKVLQGCDAGGRYQMKSAAASPERLVIDSEDKLYADLPLGVARLKGYLEQGSRLTLEYVAVGQQVADGEPLALQGGAACEGATHYVRAMAKLLAIDDEVLSKSQKDAYQREYDRAYSPFREILSDCEGWRARAGQPWVATVVERQAQSEKDATERGDQEQQRVVSDKYGTVRKWKKVSTVGGVVLLGGGAAMFATGYLLSKGATGDCVGAACPSSAKGSVSTANLVGSIGIVAAAVGAVGLIGGLVWPLPQAPRSEARVHIGPGPGDVGVSTVFKF